MALPYFHFQGDCSMTCFYTEFIIDHFQGVSCGIRETMVSPVTWGKYTGANCESLLYGSHLRAPNMCIRVQSKTINIVIFMRASMKSSSRNEMNLSSDFAHALRRKWCLRYRAILQTKTGKKNCLHVHMVIHCQVPQWHILITRYTWHIHVWPIQALTSWPWRRLSSLALQDVLS